MKQSDIKVGCRYVNKHGKRTVRTVIAIGPEKIAVNEPYWWGNPEKRPRDLVVTFTTTNKKYKQGDCHQFIKTFSAWAGNIA